MASSKLSGTKKTDYTTTVSKEGAGQFRRMQNVLLIWLDNSIVENSDECKSTITQLRCVINDITTHTDGDQCIRFIETIEDSKVCMIISGSIGQHVVPRVHDMSQVDSLFIFCGNKRRHEGWAKDWPKVKGVFTEITPICEALKQAARQCEHNATSMSFVATGKKLDQLDPSFMYTQILKEILLTIDFGEQHIKEYVAYCRKEFAENTAELKHIKQLEQQYQDKTSIWWYTCDCFLYRMVNRALRTMNGDLITRMGFFIKDLHRHIEQVHKEQYGGDVSVPAFKVYRGQVLSKEDFNQLRQTKGGLMSFNCFLSTSKKPNVSMEFAEEATNSPDMVGILFEMEIDPAQSTTPFASIGKLSAFESEDEVLFGMHSLFRVRDIKSKDGNNSLYDVHLSLTSDNDKELRALTECIREESCPNAREWERLAAVLMDMGQLKPAEEIYQTLLRQATKESDYLPIYNQLGTIKTNEGEYQEAIQFYEKVLAIQKQSLSPTHLDLAGTYGNIGNVYSRLGDHARALSSHEKALTIQQQSLPPTALDLAMSYNNIGAVYSSLVDNPKALLSYEKALAIQQKSLPFNHPDLAATHNNVGGVHGSMGDDSKALACFEKALRIQQQSLPSTHPDLALTYNNIGAVYENMEDYAKACTFYERAVHIAKQSLPATHPDLKDYRQCLADVQKKQ